MPLVSFNGGIRFPSGKETATIMPINTIAVPQRCHYPLRKGRISYYPAVAQGDNVREGQIIARTSDSNEPPLHSSIPGRITEIVPDSDGRCFLSITVETSGSFISAHDEHHDHWQSLSSDEIRSVISESGIPLPFQENTPDDLDALIVNAIDQEPFLSSRAATLAAYPSMIAEGIDILIRCTGAKHAIVAVTRRTMESAGRLETEYMNKTGHPLRFKILSSKYPRGFPSFIIREITGTGRYPASGSNRYPVIDIEYVYAAYEAIVKNKPFFERVITVAGDAASRPGNYKIRNGTPVAHIMDECGLPGLKPSSVIIGGPLTGRNTDNLNTPVTLSTGAVIFLSRSIHQIAGKRYPCIHCGFCADVCPVRINPLEVAESIIRGVSPVIRSFCIGCGCCAASCPSRIPLSSIIHSRSDHGYSDV
jgi:electron transport complex protein RnfC